ncbi:hypothetical protein QQS21_004739 [Conoideocrella luteorostrata]|uniref:Uncharacterized protein n=1 Tax=Conoideocrella luteorostrata TaxID=1105319 RepID=A0AAJ0CR03_9HYPO|nr:hypothetical protein QQS21_004739 [Conoideocrella luteorostrata]
MAPTKRSAKSDATLAENLGASAADMQTTAVAKMDRLAPKTADTDSKLPYALQFPLTVALSMALSTLGSVIMSQVSKGELDSLTRSPETWNGVAIVAGWKIIELALAWFGKLDSLEAAAMNVLAHGPVMYLLAAFYGLSPAAAFSALAIDVLAIAVPFYLVLPLSTADDASIRQSNRELLDIPMQLLTTLLSTGIYTVTLVLSLRFLLPRILVVYFNGLPSLEPAYSASYAEILPVTILFGLASSTFIFAPFATTGKAKEDTKIEEFDPVNASLSQTVWWNFWGYTAKTKVVIRRTAAAAVLTGVSTYLACSQNIYGIDSTGAVAYASVWVAATLLTGVGLGLVGGE